jgi:hypothetical protein
MVNQMSIAELITATKPIAILTRAAEDTLVAFEDEVDPATVLELVGEVDLELAEVGAVAVGLLRVELWAGELED